MLKKYKVEIEICGPEYSTCEDVFEYMSAVTRDSDISEINDVFAVGNIEILEEDKVTVDEWNGDAVSEEALEEFE